MVLKWNLRMWVVGCWIHLAEDREQWEFLWTWQQTFKFQTMFGISWASQQPSASKKDLRSMKLRQFFLAFNFTTNKMENLCTVQWDCSGFTVLCLIMSQTLNTNTKSILGIKCLIYNENPFSSVQVIAYGWTERWTDRQAGWSWQAHLCKF
jgi:hypothetical protein